MDLTKKQSANFNKMSKAEKDNYIKNIVTKSVKIKYPTNKEESNKYQYKFWPNQPVINNEKDMVYSKPIHEKLEKIEMPLNDIFDNVELQYQDICSESIMNNVLKYLNEAMVNDKLNIHYDKNYLNILLGTNKIILGLKKKDKTNLCGIICCGIKKFKVGCETNNFADVRILCLNKSLQNKRYSEFMINGLKNILLDKNINYGIFMTNRYIPIPISKIEIFYRPLNYSKLHTIGLCTTIDKKMLDYNITKYNLKNIIPTNIVKIDMTNICDVYNLYLEYCEKFYLYRQFTYLEFVDLINNNNNSAYALIKNSQEKKICEFFVYHKCYVKYKNNFVQCAELIMYSNVSVDYTASKILNIISQVAYCEKIDILLVGNNFESESSLKDVDGYYSELNKVNYINLYNWQYTKLDQNQIGFL